MENVEYGFVYAVDSGEKYSDDCGDGLVGRNRCRLYVRT